MATITNKHPKIIEPNPEEPSEDLLRVESEMSVSEKYIFAGIVILLAASAVAVVFLR